MSDTPPDPASVKYEATPRDQARTYQTGGAQHITEYHYHGTPPGPPKRSMSLPKRVLLAAGLAVVLGGGGSAALWAFGPWQSADDDQGTAAANVSSSPSPSASPSASPQPTAEAKDSAAPPAVQSEPAPKSSASGVAAPPVEAPSSSPSPKQKQADSCHGRTSVRDVTIDVCVRREGEDIYMMYQLTGAETPQLVDVYLWLEDTATKEVVDYVKTTNKPYTYDNIRADLTPLWREHVVEATLRHGTSYEVCVGVTPPDAKTPDFKSPNLSGVTRGFVY
ncbi:hypothetical protein AB0L55_23860 [Streptomyces anthocyanicus]|uniref:hypothetical protein n=1 Tax=Streptomyces anthocyanicus TaxID=68174 RepID=UPI00341DCFAE